MPEGLGYPEDEMAIAEELAGVSDPQQILSLLSEKGWKLEKSGGMGGMDEEPLDEEPVDEEPSDEPAKKDSFKPTEGPPSGGMGLMLRLGGPEGLRNRAAKKALGGK